MSVNDPCTNRFGVDTVVGEVCHLCGHNSLVHGGHHNPGLDACAICTVLLAALRLEERTSPVIQMNVTQSEADRMLNGIRHEPKPTEDVKRTVGAWWSSCSLCKGVIKSINVVGWVHDPPRWAEVGAHDPVPAARESPSHNVSRSWCMVCECPLVPESPVPKGQWGKWVHAPTPSQREQTPTPPPRCPRMSMDGTQQCFLPDRQKDHTDRHRSLTGGIFWLIDGNDLERWRSNPWP